MNRFIILLFTTFLFANENYDTSFITPYEYGKMLFQSPRGISCVKCHGENGQGKKIATFTHTNSKKKKKYSCTIKTPDITNIDYQTFLQVLDPKLEKPKKKFDKTQVCAKLTYGNSMPTYFLTKEELKSIHFYLTNMDKYEIK